MAGRPRMFDELISKARALGASDVHLEAETPIVARIRGELHVLCRQKRTETQSRRSPQRLRPDRSMDQRSAMNPRAGEDSVV